jgi:hypothetical protein
LQTNKREGISVVQHCSPGSQPPHWIYCANRPEDENPFRLNACARVQHFYFGARFGAGRAPVAEIR